MEEEIWKPIYDGYYAVSNIGRLKRLKGGRGIVANKILKVFINKKRGYAYMSTWKDGKNKTILAHRVVMEGFKGPCPVGYEVNHKNGIKTDNRLENLEYVTSSENKRHALTIGLNLNFGENCPFSKLTDQKVIKIREFHAQGIVQRQIAEKFSITPATICRVVNRKIWRHI